MSSARPGKMPLDVGSALKENVFEQAFTWYQSIEWTGSVHRIENPIQSKCIWTGLDYKITCSMDSGLDGIGNLPFTLINDHDH